VGEEAVVRGNLYILFYLHSRCGGTVGGSSSKCLYVDLPNPNDPVLLVHVNGTDNTAVSRAYSRISAHALTHNNANLCDMRTWHELDRNRMHPDSD